MTSDLRSEVEIRKFRARTMHPVIGLIGNSSVIVHLAMRQIPCSTKRMSRHYLKRLIQYGEFQPPRSLIAVANIVPTMVI